MAKKSSGKPKQVAKKKSETPNFQGFSTETFKFLRDLAKHNDRDWFAENKQRYEDDVLAPSLAFIESMQPFVRKLSPYLTAIPKRVGGSLMRIYRDTRFSKNKTPYKTNVGIHFRHEIGGDVHGPGFYL
ncbi:MAG: TIGR02453 family protein, partial [Pirellulaceae bacterium]|nr:TIGR02453 family protein [Pirellulaceae bacterium]